VSNLIDKENKMAQTTLHSGGYKNNNTTMLGAGNVPSTGPASLTLANNNTDVPKNNTLPASGTNVGVIKAIAARPFNQQEAGEYVGMIVCDRVAQTASTTLLGGSADFSQDPHGYWPGYNRRAKTINAETGAITTGANNGVAVVPSSERAYPNCAALPPRVFSISFSCCFAVRTSSVAIKTLFSFT
jgi:hypothetical protein